MHYIFIFLLLFFNIVAYTQHPLIPTEEEALLLVQVSDMEYTPRVKDKIIFVGKTSQQSFEGVTNQEGTFSILLPEGDIYWIKIQGLGSQIDFDEIAIPQQPGKISGEIEVRYRPPQKFTLDDVHFESGKSNLLPSSIPTLKELAKILLLKETMRIEIAGHTDNVGNDHNNQLLSLHRAEAVVQFLIQQGISPERLVAKGYGETTPIASNDSPEGRQENRRTEARIL